MNARVPFTFDRFYHVFNRSNAYQKVFLSSENYRYFLSKYARTVSPFVETWAFCLMPTHFHFLIRTKSQTSLDLLKTPANTSGIVDANRFFAYRFAGAIGGYTQGFNKTYNRHGSLFQRTLKRIEINDNFQLQETMLYIHTNPVKDGLVQNASDWWPSSFNFYLNQQQTILDEELEFPELISTAQKDAVHSVFSGLDVFSARHDQRFAPKSY